MKQNSVDLLTTALPPNADKWTYPGNPPPCREKSESAESHLIPSLFYPSAVSGGEFRIFCPLRRYFSSKLVAESNEINENATKTNILTKTWELIMVTRRINFGFLVCFLIAVFVGQTLSQTRGYRRTRGRSASGRLENMNKKAHERHKQQLEQLKKQMGLGKSERELMEQVLRATEEQWKAIKPKLNKVRKLKGRADVSIRLMRYGVRGMSGSSEGVGRGSMSGFSSNVELGEGGTVQKRGGAASSPTRIDYGWRWSRPSRHRGFENLNEGEKICEELFELLEDGNSELEKIRQKMEALQKFRQDTKKELAIAQKELRQLVTPRQEAALIMMGLLD